MLFSVMACMAAASWAQYDDIYADFDKKPATQPAQAGPADAYEEITSSRPTRDIDEYNRQYTTRTETEPVESETEDFSATRQIVKYHNAGAVTINDPQYVYINEENDNEAESGAADSDAAAAFAAGYLLGAGTAPYYDWYYASPVFWYHRPYYSWYYWHDPWYYSWYRPYYHPYWHGYGYGYHHHRPHPSWNHPGPYYPRTHAWQRPGYATSSGSRSQAAANRPAAARPATATASHTVNAPTQRSNAPTVTRSTAPATTRSTISSAPRSTSSYNGAPRSTSTYQAPSRSTGSYGGNTTRSTGSYGGSYSAPRSTGSGMRSTAPSYGGASRGSMGGGSYGTTRSTAGHR